MSLRMPNFDDGVVYPTEQDNKDEVRVCDSCFMNPAQEAFVMSTKLGTTKFITNVYLCHKCAKTIDWTFIGIPTDWDAKVKIEGVGE